MTVSTTLPGGVDKLPLIQTNADHSLYTCNDRPLLSTDSFQGIVSDHYHARRTPGYTYDIWLLVFVKAGI